MDRIARAAELVDRVAHEDLVALPTLTKEELAVMGSLEASPLRDKSEIRYWTELSQESRKAAGAAALRSLSARHLVDLSQRVEPDASGNVSINPAPELGLILAARRQPSFVAVGSEPQRGLIGFVRLYGVIDERRDMNIVLLERTTGNGVHEFAICTPERAADEVSAWACGPDPMKNGDKLGTLVRTFEVTRPSEAGPSRRRLAVLVSDASTLLGEFDDQGGITDRGPITVEALSERLRSMLAELGTPG